MLNLAVLTPNSMAADAIEQMTADAGIFHVVFKSSPTANTIPATLRTVRMHEPDVVLLDIGDWDSVAPLAAQFKASEVPNVIGFRPTWNRLEQVMFEQGGIQHLLREPFSHAELEAIIYEAVHKVGVANRNILAFLPAKAGGGCSSVAIHAGAALASLSKKVLLVECDRRSGVYSIMLNLKNRQGLDSALRMGKAMSSGEWFQHAINVQGLHLLPAHPKINGTFPTWTDYYQLIQYVQNLYEYLLVDLPEVVNDATAEIVRSARSVFIVCTPEIASLKMARVRAEELEACEIPADRVHVIVNRWERSSPRTEELEEMLERPVFGTLPNDYGHLKSAMMKSQLADSDSPFAEACLGLAKKLGGPAEMAPSRFKLALLRKLGRLAG